MPQLRVNGIGSEHFIQGALKEGQPDHNVHDFKWIRRERFPAAIVGRAAHGQKERSLLHPGRQPRAVGFSLLNFYLARGYPDEDWLTYRRNVPRLPG